MAKKVTVWHEAPKALQGKIGGDGVEVDLKEVPVQPIGMRAFVTFVIPDYCSDCIYCEGTCANLKFNKERKIMVVNQVGCRGCGQCISSCPTGALQQRNTYLGKIDEDFTHLLGKEPAAVPQSCNLCPVVSGEMPDQGNGPNSVRLLCSGRFEASLALEALTKGCKGVVVVGCLFKDFPFERNKVAIEDKLRFSKLLMMRLGINPDKVQHVNKYLTEGGVRECIQRLSGA